MSDDLEDVLRSAMIKQGIYPAGIEVAAIAAAIRSRWCWPLGTKHVFISGIDKCMNCEQPKPGPTPGDEHTDECKIWGPRHGNWIGKPSECKCWCHPVDAEAAKQTTNDPTVVDERGVDAEAIKMWRDK